MTNFNLMQKSTVLSLYCDLKLIATSKHTLAHLDNVRCAIKAFYHNPTNGMYCVACNRIKTALKMYNLYH